MSSNNMWIDATDWSTLFQDDEGLIPVTAAGQPVRLLRDKSGNGNHLRVRFGDPSLISAITPDGIPCVDGFGQQPLDKL